ncbi:MAG: hypothetical protein AB1810_14615 [Pseudomonadota bacterium]
MKTANLTDQLPPQGHMKGKLSHFCLPINRSAHRTVTGQLFSKNQLMVDESEKKWVFLQVR